MKKNWRASGVWGWLAMIGGMVALIASVIWKPYSTEVLEK